MTGLTYTVGRMSTKGISKMVGWDMTVKFLGLSPHIQELAQLAQKEGFSNIEELTPQGDGIYYLSVNNRATNQTDFKTEIIQ